MSQGQSQHRDAGVHAKGAGTGGGGGGGAGGGLGLLESKVGWDRDFPATLKAPESERS